MSNDSILDSSLNIDTENHYISTDSDNSSTTHRSLIKSKSKKMDSCIRITSFIFCTTVLFIAICLFNFSHQQTSTIIQKDVVPLFDTNFTNTSCKLVDSYDGDLKHISSAIETNEFVFIYMYADWCARSHTFKKLVEDLALKYSNKISFHAVNCFNQAGSCRNHFNLHKYPQIAFQIRNVGLYYYQGPFEYTYISKYIDLMQAPLTRIDSLEDFTSFVIQNDGAVVGNFNFSDDYDNKLYNIFYHSAIKTYHSNFENPTRYAVILNKTVLNTLLQFEPKLKDAHSSNKKITLFSVFGLQEHYHLSTKRISVEKLTMWVKMSIKKSLNWLYPDKYKMNFDNRNRMLIFIEKYTGNQTLDDSSDIRKEFAISKYVAIQSRLSAMKIKQPQRKNQFLNLILDKMEISFDTRRLKCSHVTRFEELYMPVVKSSFCKKSLINPNISVKFARTFDVYLMDKNLYASYAHNLLNGSISNFFSGSKPIILFADYKNESLFSMDNRFNYRNLREFIRKQSNGVNKRFLRNDQTVHKNTNVNFVQSINSKELNQLIEKQSNSKFFDKDTLVFYYAKWCGYCKLFNFKLMKLMHQYFRNVKSIKLLKINCDANDFSWNTYASTIPFLLFIPAQSQKTETNKTIESHSYENSASLTEENLIRFILYNSKNPLTILDFLKENFINPKTLSGELLKTSEKNKLNNIFTELVSTKLKDLTSNSNYVTGKLTSIYYTMNGTSSALFDGSPYDIGFFNNIKTSLSNKLEMYLHEIDLLKQLENLFL